MKKLLLVLALLIFSAPAFAGSGTIAVTPGSGATIATTTDGSANNLPHNVICDATAGANCTGVDSSSALKMTLINIGTTTAVAPSFGNGATDSATQRVTISNDSTGLVKLAAGANAIGSVTIGATATTSYGLQSGASTNSTSVAAGAHTITGMNLINTTTTIYYLRMYDAASAPTCSSATGFKRSWPIPPAAASGGAGGIAVNLGAYGTTFTTGIAFCLTGGPSSTDNTNAATGVFVNLDYL